MGSAVEWGMVGRLGMAGVHGAGTCRRVSEVGGRVTPHSHPTLLRGPFPVLLGLGIFFNWLVCQIVLHRIGQQLWNNDYLGTHGIQLMQREVGVDPRGA